MARTVAGKRAEAAPDPSPRALASRWRFRGKGGCGYCTVLTTNGVRHDLCTDSPDKTWRCRCAQQGHQEGQ